MASQLYSRYVPPTKSRGKGENISIVSPSTSSRTQIPAAVLPSTQPDASSTYARYIPPPKSKSQINVSDVTNSPVMSKAKRKSHEISNGGIGSGEIPTRRKKSTTAQAREVELQNSALFEDVDKEIASRVDEEPMASIRSGKKSKRKKLKEELEIGSVVEDATSKEDNRHKSVLLKKEKALRKLKNADNQEVLNTIESDQEREELQRTLHDLVPLPQPEPVPETTGRATFESLPSWLASPITVSVSTTDKFTNLGVPEDVAQALNEAKFENAFAVQAAVLPLLLPGLKQRAGDVLVSAATGSGKTLGYVLPMVDDISKKVVTRLRGLIVMPTRELVTQAREVCETCATAYRVGGRRRLRVGIAVGNQPLKTEQASLMEQELVYDPEEYRRRETRMNGRWETSSNESGGNLYVEEELVLPDHILESRPKVDILVCTPGRLVEHLKTTPGFTLDFINWLIIDEADKLLDQSYQQWLEVVMSKLKGSVRKIVLSATMTRDLGQLSALKLHRPKLVVLEGSKESTGEILNLPNTLRESGVKVDENDKPLFLLELIRMIGATTETGPLSSDENADENSNDSSDNSINGLLNENQPLPKPRGIIIFTKSNENALRLSRLIGILDSSLGETIGTLTSTIKNSVRKATLKDFHSGKRSILIASDLVARGLDLPTLAHVINYDMPSSLSNYVHRVGRTARAGKEGHAWTLFTPTEARWFWNDIARTNLLQRKAKVQRLNLKVEFDRDQYDRALATLGDEATQRPKPAK